MVLTEGWDMPEVGCCILARPTRKMGLYRQMIGRVLRPAEGKPDAIVLDHSGAVFRHGFVEDPVEWTLDPDRRAVSRRISNARQPTAARACIECSQCGAVRTAGEPCSHCGFLPQRPPRSVDFIDGDLGLVDGDAQSQSRSTDPAVRARWHAMLTWIAEERGYKPGWVAHKYKEKFGIWPPWGARPEPSSRHPRAAVGCARARSLLRGGQHEETQDRRPVCTAHDRNVALAGIARVEPDRRGAFSTASRSNSPATAARTTASCRSRSLIS